MGGSTRFMHKGGAIIKKILTCPDDHSLHQLPRVEARLDDLRATEQRVPLVRLRAVVGLRLQARGGQAGLGDRDALPWRQGGGFERQRVGGGGGRLEETDDRRRNPTGQHALVHDAGSLNEHGVARHDHPIGRDDDDVARHELRGHGLVNVWGGGVTGTEHFDVRANQ